MSDISTEQDETSEIVTVLEWSEKMPWKLLALLSVSECG